MIAAMSGSRSELQAGAGIETWLQFCATLRSAMQGRRHVRAALPLPLSHHRGRSGLAPDHKGDRS